MQKHFLKNMLSTCAVMFFGAFLLLSCGSQKNFVVPHSVSTAAVTTIKDLNLTKDQYDVLKTVKESASVICEYKGNSIRITSGDGDFAYNFYFDAKRGWTLMSFSGAASLGYFTEDYTEGESAAPAPEEFARRVAMARIISAAADYNADGIIEPITVTSATSAGNHKVEYRSTVRAKLISIKNAK